MAHDKCIMAEQKVNFQQDRGEKAEKTDYRIVVLGDDNYITWKWHMTMVLKAKGLFACVESDLVLELDKAVQATTLLASALDIGPKTAGKSSEILRTRKSRSLMMSNSPLL